jgi:group I intron endonuclease
MVSNKKSGIYKIENILNGTCYIGQSVDLNKRKNTHLRDLKKNIHYNEYLQKAFNKYGSENFIFKIILYCEKDQLNYYEQKIVDMCNLKYNIKKECISSNLGIIVTKEAREKMSIARRGKLKSKEHKNKISLSHIGMKYSEETKKKVSENHANTKGMNNGNFKKKEVIEIIKYVLDAGKTIAETERITGYERHLVSKVKNGYYKKYYGI